MTNTSSVIELEVERDYRHNFIVNFLDGTAFWFGASFWATRTIFPVYIANLTDSKFAIALLSVIVSTGWLLPQIFTANWTQRMPQKKYIAVTIGFWTERLPVLLLVPAAWLATISKELALIASLIFMTWHIIGAGVIAVSWQDMIAKIFPVDRRGKFFGVTNFSGTAAGILGASTVAWLLNHHEFPYSYVWSFGIGAFFILLSWVFLALVKEPYIEPKTAPISNREYLKQLPAIVRGDTNFRRYLITQIFIGGGNIAIGFLAVYAIQRWNLPDSQAGIYTIAMLSGQAISGLLFGWLADRRGHKLVLTLSVSGMALSVGVALLASAPIWFLAVFFLSGVSTAGFMISGIMIVFEFCTADIRPTYIGINNTFNGVIAIIMPLLGGCLAKNFGYPAMFAVTGIVTTIGLLLLIFWVREPRYVMVDD